LLIRGYMHQNSKRIAAALAAFLMLGSMPIAGPAATPAPRHPAKQLRLPHIFADQLKTLDGGTARVYSDGYVQIRHKQGPMEYRWIPLAEVPNRHLPADTLKAMEMRLVAKLAVPKPKLYTPGELIVTFREGVSPASDTVTIPSAAVRKYLSAKPSARRSLVPSYTNDANLNAVLADLGVTQMHRLGRSVSRAVLSMRASRATAATHHTVLDVGNTFVLHVGGAVPKAVKRLMKTMAVAYATPNWQVVPMHTPLLPLSSRTMQNGSRATASELRRATSVSGHAGIVPSTLPGNFTLWSSEASQLNATGMDAAAAWDEIASNFNQIPGQGEIITNVSIGDIFGPTDPRPGTICDNENQTFGAPTEVIGGQRYLNWPGFPLIPAYVADQDGQIDPSYYSCGMDPFLEEIGLDFSMMAPLPDSMQRAGEQANGPADLLGIAPGASYRLVVPATNAGNGFDFSEIAGALLAAAQQQPAPNVITASLGYGLDGVGFAGRYLEDDPLMQSIIAQIVAQGIVVCVSANDGTRTYTPVSIGPSGGSVATNLAATQADTTSLLDDALSGEPSRDMDSGSIDVGATTLDDIFSQPLNDPAAAAFRDVGAYATTRWNGSQGYSSGFGNRVNVSAPGDGLVVATRDTGGGAPDATSLFISGGTSASAPETAAAAAIALQVARLTGHPFANATDLRNFLVSTASPVNAPVQQADQNLNVGPQINVRRIVETLLAQSGHPVSPRVARVAIAQRRPVDYSQTQDAFYVTNTDPGYISLRGTPDYYTDELDGTSWFAPITIAPDWEGMPSDAHYKLFIAGKPDAVLGTGAWSRLTPSAILSAAGLPVVSNAQRTVSLTYRAYTGYHTLAQTNFTLTFGPTDGTALGAPAPVVSGGLVTGDTATVNYDVTGIRAASFTDPEIIVSVPGHLFSSHMGGQILWETPLTAPHGTVQVPVNQLAGDGIYQVALLGYDTNPIAEARNYGLPVPRLSDIGTFRIARAGSGRPSAPTISLSGDTTTAPGHFLEIPYGGSVDVHYNVANVPGANGAVVEVGTGGPNFFNLMNTFNNPNGSVRDNNGFDTGSVSFIPVSGTAGTVTLSAQQLGLISTLYQNVRVLPMNGSVPAGEASDVSTVRMDGLATLDGGDLIGGEGLFTTGGFSINRNGTDGIIATEDFFGNTTLQGIDQNANAANGIIHLAAGVSVAYPNEYGPYAIMGGGLMANDVVMFAQRQYSDFVDYYNTQFSVYNTLSAAIASSGGGGLGDGGGGGIGHGGINGGPLASDQVVMPTLTQGIFMAADNQDTDTVALLGYDKAAASNQLRVFTYSVQNNAIVNTIDPGMGNPEDYPFFGINFAQDTSLNKALILGAPPGDVCQAPVGRVVDLNTGVSTPVDTTGVYGAIEGAVIDSSTHTAFFQSVCDQALIAYDMQTGSKRKFYMPAHDLFVNFPVGSIGIGGWEASSMAIDPVNHLLLVSQVVPADLFSLNYNALMQVHVYDESGNLIKTMEQFQLAGSRDFGNDREFLQVNPNTRTGYVATGFGNEIAIFKY
jgi:hypothetical protein